MDILFIGTTLTDVELVTTPPKQPKQKSLQQKDLPIIYRATERKDSFDYLIFYTTNSNNSSI